VLHRSLFRFFLIYVAFAGLGRGETAIWAEGSVAKIRPDTAPPAETYVWDGERISLRAARGEWAPFQIVIKSGEPRVVAFEIYDLVGPRGKVAAANFSVYRELYVTVDWPSVDPATNFTVGSGRGRWPDPLVPVIGHADVAGGENTVYWLELFVPPGTLSGEYTGKITLRWSGGEVTLPLELAVWDFEVPRDLAPPFIAALNAKEICRLYDVKAETEKGRAVVEKYYAMLREHGFWPGAAEKGALGAEAALPKELFDGYPFRECVVKSFAEAEAYPETLAELRQEEVGVALRAGGFADYIDRPATDHRAVGWALWRFGGDVATWGDASYFPRKDGNPIAGDPRNEWGNGAYALIYPGAGTGTNRPSPSLRLKLVREAAEDYAYLWALKEAGLAAYADELATGVVPTLSPPGSDGVDPASLYEAREAAAIALVKSGWGQGIAENAVRGRTTSDEGAPVTRAVVRAGPVAAVTDRNGDYELKYVARGRPLVATTPGYERAGSSGAGGRGDFVLKSFLRRYVWNVAETPPDISDRGFEEARLSPNANYVGGPALVGRLSGGRAGVVEFRPQVRDWSTFGGFVVELYNGSSGRVAALVRVTDESDAFYKERFLLPTRCWTAARVDLELAGGRYYLEARKRRGGLEFTSRPRVDFGAVREVRLSLEGPERAEVRVGRIWLEARED
jgi:hypothetical protein